MDDIIEFDTNYRVQELTALMCFTQHMLLISVEQPSSQIPLSIAFNTAITGLTLRGFSFLLFLLFTYIRIQANTQICTYSKSVYKTSRYSIYVQLLLLPTRMWVSPLYECKDLERSLVTVCWQWYNTLVITRHMTLCLADIWADHSWQWQPLRQTMSDGHMIAAQQVMGPG